MRPKNMLVRQSNEIARAIKTAGQETSGFRWEEEKSDSSNRDIDTIIHKDSGYYFKFDYYDSDLLNDSGGRVARYSPGNEYVHEQSKRASWEGMLLCFKSWLKNLKKELEPNLWSDSEPKEFEEWADSDQHFKPAEIKKLNEGLDRVESLLIESSDKTEKTLKDISKNIEFLKTTAEKSTKQEFKYIFIGLIINKLADWAIKTISIQQVILVLVNSVKSILPGN